MRMMDRGIEYHSTLQSDTPSNYIMWLLQSADRRGACQGGTGSRDADGEDASEVCPFDGYSSTMRWRSVNRMQGFDLGAGERTVDRQRMKFMECARFEYVPLLGCALQHILQGHHPLRPVHTEAHHRESG